MADQIQQLTGFMPEMQDINRQREIAKMLLQRGMQPNQGQMVSGRFVGASPLEHLAGAYETYKAGQLAKEADKKTADLAERIRKQNITDVNDVISLLRGTPEQTVYGAGEEGPTRTVTPAVAPDRGAALARALGSQSPAAQMIGGELIKQQFREPKFHVVDGNLVNEQGQIVFTAPKDRAGQVVETASGFALVDPRSGVVKPLTDASGQPLMGTKGNLPEGATKQVTGATNLKSAIDNYKEKLKNFKTFDMANPNARAEMGNAYNNMMLQAKEAYNLGVLNGPDYAILQSVVKDPTSMSALLVSKSALEKQANDLSKTADTIIENAYKTHNKPVPSSANVGEKPKTIDFNSLK